MENPVLIQKAARRYKSAIPIFLFHDGGGIVLPYYFLESLNRNVWGISYPHLKDGGIFEDGMKGMGELYAGLIRGKVSRGKILLGGWSAGGSIAIQVAKCLENIPEICVAGTIMLDTPFPDFPDWRPKDAPPVQFHLPVALDQTAQSRLAQQQVVNDIIHALSVWELPTWDNGRRPPPAVFIRALEVVPTEKVVEVDWFRGEYALGWRKYPYEFIIQELRVHGDHFSIFTPLYLPELSTKLREACELLHSKQEFSMLLDSKQDSKHSSTVLVTALKSC